MFTISGGKGRIFSFQGAKERFVSFRGERKSSSSFRGRESSFWGKKKDPFLSGQRKELSPFGGGFGGEGRTSFLSEGKGKTLCLSAEKERSLSFRCEKEPRLTGMTLTFPSACTALSAPTPRAHRPISGEPQRTATRSSGRSECSPSCTGRSRAWQPEHTCQGFIHWNRRCLHHWGETRAGAIRVGGSEKRHKPWGSS
jgi:hypothetical protein